MEHTIKFRFTIEDLSVNEIIKKVSEFLIYLLVELISIFFDMLFPEFFRRLKIFIFSGFTIDLVLILWNPESNVVERNQLILGEVIECIVTS